MAIQDLADRVLAYAERRAISGDSQATEISGLHVACHYRPTELAPLLYQPIFCLVLQGAKEALLGDGTVAFSERQSVIVGPELPTFARVVQASEARPYIALALRLDLALIREMAAEVVGRGQEDGEACAIAAAEADDALVAAMARLFGLLDQPAALPFLQPLLLREIHFWLLNAEHGALLRQLTLANSHASRIAEAIVHIRRHYAESLAVPDLARAAGMSVSAFHQHFRAISGTTPLQYQKRLRLLEARRLVTSEGRSVSAAAYDVGYESPTQFSREYARMFGLAPREHRRILTVTAPEADRLASF